MKALVKNGVRCLPREIPNLTQVFFFLVFFFATRGGTVPLVSTVMNAVDYKESLE